MQTEQNRISELEDKNLEIIRVKKDIELKILKSETLQESSDAIKKANIRLWVYQKERKQQSIKERITEDSPNLGKELDIKCKKLMEHLIISMHKDLSQDIMKLSKVNDKEF